MHDRDFQLPMKLPEERSPLTAVELSAHTADPRAGRRGAMSGNLSTHNL